MCSPEATTDAPADAGAGAGCYSISLPDLLSWLLSAPRRFQQQAAYGKQQDHCFWDEESRAFRDQAIDPDTEKTHDDGSRYGRRDQAHTGDKTPCRDETRKTEYRETKWKCPKPNTRSRRRQRGVQRGASGSCGTYRIGDTAQTDHGEDQSCRRQNEPVNPGCKTPKTSHCSFLV